MIVSEIMSSPRCVVGPETTVGEATTLMGEAQVGSALVVESDRLIGILTERDVLRSLSAEHDAPRRPVVEWMTRSPYTTGPDSEVRDALRIMVDGGFRHLPVVDGGRVVGVLSMRDVARALAG